MSKMKAKFRKGSSRFGKIVVSAMLAVLLAAAGSATASAWFGGGSSSKFELYTRTDTATNQTAKDGKFSASLTETINFQADNIFSAKSLSQINYLTIETSDMGTSRPLSLELTATTPKYWTEDTTKNPAYEAKYTYGSSTSSITSGTFTGIMSQLSVKFNSASGLKNGTGKVTIKGYKDNPSKSGTKAIGSTYTCSFTFYDYAEAMPVDGSAVMDYKADYAKDYNTTYDDAIPEGKVNGALVQSPDTAGGKAEFSLKLSQISSGGSYKAKVGYQIKKSTDSWTSSLAKNWLKVSGSDSSGNIDLKKWDLSKEIPVSVSGLEAGVTYNIRGVVSTDGKDSSPKYTDEVSFRYNKPNINAFNIGGVSQVYQGGKANSMPLSMLITFNDNNAVGRNYDVEMDDDGAAEDLDADVPQAAAANTTTFTGPAMRADVYFTAKADLGTGANAKDNSVWYKIPGLTAYKLLTDDNGDMLTSFTEKDINSTITSKWGSYNIPGTLADLGNPLTAGLTEQINSDACAFKLVVTDLYTGYSTVTYSDCFTIDSSAPTEPELSATLPSGDVNMKDYFPNNSGASGLVVGGVSEDGGSSQVTLKIGGSMDEGGSGIKNYSYQMYSMTSDLVPTYLTTTEEVLSLLGGYDSAHHGTPNTAGYAEFKDWTILSTEADGSGSATAELVIARDGYYRVVVRAEDEAGFQSQEVEAYFRVDMTAPNTPELRLAKQVSGTSASTYKFEPYDNRTYTDSTVWAFAYSKPKTAKEIAAFKFSTNGGLTWKTIDAKDNSEATGVPAQYKILKMNNTTDTVPSYRGDVSVDSTVDNFVYQVGINLTGMGYSDYVSILVKAVDTLGNESLVSNERHIRTSSQVKAVASISHDPIEVAMALGNTNLSMEKNIKLIKMRAAQIINEKYYGTTPTGTNINNPSTFNPYLYTKDHTCTYATDSATGSCVDPKGCPYDTVEAAGYSIYKPEWINISGLVSGVEGMTVTEWTPYDHNTYDAVGNSDAIKNGYIIDPPSEKGYIKAEADDNSSSENDIDDPGKYKAGSNYCGTVMHRRRHILDASKTATFDGDWSSILFMGYGHNANTDWLFHHFTQPTNKTIIFSMDVSKGSFHTYKQAGFWFNTTIRKNQAGKWVVSGYRLMLVAKTGSWQLKDVEARGAGTAATNCELQLQKITDMEIEKIANDTKTNGDTTGGGLYLGTKVASFSPSGEGLAVQSFMIDLTASTCTVYQYQSNTMPARATLTKSFFQKSGTQIMYTEGLTRPTVDGYEIGNTTQTINGKLNPYNDTDCYGFGPCIGYSNISHTCTKETRITFSNVSISYNLGRTLSEVVTEPAWGDGKSRFILNMTDDSQSDFKEPSLTAQIQWRLKNDNARYIGWGDASTKAETEAFLKRMAGSDATAKQLREYGLFETHTPRTAEEGSPTEIGNLATYITEQYYADLGYDTTLGTTIKQQVTPTVGGGKIISYTLDNIGNINLTVDPPERAESSANPDFPSGRWYMVHDVTGMAGAVTAQEIAQATDQRSGKFSDALQTDLTLPGRYTYYFAPPTDLVNGTNGKVLDPSTAVFDFVVNQPPVSQFSATIDDSNVVHITNASHDPDCKNEANPVMANGVKLSGIVKTEYKWQLLIKSGDDTSMPVDTSWSTTSPDGKTIAVLTNNKYTSLPANSVLTISQRVTDTISYRVINAAGTGYEYKSATGDSAVSVVNATKGVDITFAPSSKLKVSSTLIYDTANDPAAAGREITFERESDHLQNKPFALTWYANLTAYGVKGDDDGLVQLTADANYNYKYKDDIILECVEKPKEGSPQIGGQVVDSDGKTVTKMVTPSTGGKWKLTYETLKKFAKATGNSIKLQLRESAWGISASESVKDKPGEAFITDKTGRQIDFKADDKAPSSQVVTTSSLLDGKEADYAASSYLDVTNGNRFVVITITGSEDKEGVLGGYGYYFYDKNSNGAEINGSYWQLSSPNGSGKLTKKTTAAAATQRLIPANKSSTAKMTIKIGVNAMRTIPTDSLNIALFAYDNATGKATETGANQTTKTRITDIKLSTSKPAPTEISATNAMNQRVAYISNANGFEKSTGKDVQESDLQYFSNTNVNVQFTPSKARFAPDATGALVKTTSGGQEYYQDFYEAADMTGVANITAQVKYKERQAQEWFTEEQMRQKGLTVYSFNDTPFAPAQQLTFTEDGVYEITAAVVNGSNSVGEPRTIGFTIDKKAPEGLQVKFSNEDGSDYKSETWVRSVKIEASSATDTNSDTAHYEYTKDGGKTWIDMGTLSQSSTSVTMEDSGRYVVQVRAKDRAGNELVWPQTMVVCIDTTPPETNPPTLTATSVMQEMYDSYVVSLVYDDTTGAMQYMRESETEWMSKDREVAVPTGESLRVKLIPEDGRVLAGLRLNAKGASTGTEILDQAEYNANDKAYYLTLENVTADVVLSATFLKAEEATVAYRTVSSSVFAMKFAAAMTYSALNSGESMEIEQEAEDTSPIAQLGEEIAPTADGPFYKVQVFDTDPNGLFRVNGAESVEVAAGDQVTLTMQMLQSGYRVKEIELDVGNGGTTIVNMDDVKRVQPGNMYTYEFTVVDNTDIIVTLEEIVTRKVTLTWSDCGTAELKSNEDFDDVRVLGGGEYLVPVDSDVRIEWIPSDGYDAGKLLINGKQPNDFTAGTGYQYIYHVEEAKDGEPSDIDIYVEFDVVGGKAYLYDVRVGNSNDGLPHGTITVSGEGIKVPKSGARTFVITPDPGYRLDQLLLTTKEADDWVINDVAGEAVLVSNNPRQYRYTLREPSSNGELEAIFEPQTYYLNTSSTAGGAVRFDANDSLPLSTNAIEEGRTLIFTPIPRDGYRIENLIIKKLDKDGMEIDRLELGAVGSYKIDIYDNLSVEGRFVPRAVTHYVTSHGITAVANNVRDKDDALHDQPYRFCIADAPIGTPGAHVSEWSDWSASNTITYTGIRVQGAVEEIPLEPNRQYYVYVMTRDRVGNISKVHEAGMAADEGVQPGTVYTMANMPGLLKAEALDEANNFFTKSVALTIDVGDNPVGTEYLVYYSNSSSMTDMRVANVKDPSEEEPKEPEEPESLAEEGEAEPEVFDGWSTLGAGDTFIVNDLQPGRWYYFQVVARNKDGYSTAVSKDIIGLMLSPAAPPANSLYFEEQASPIAPVILHWTQPEGEIKSVQIYRDGMFLTELNVTEREYKDEKINFPGDAIVKYSYAYVNSAGVGSSRTAVSKEYHDACESENKAKQQKMDSLLGGGAGDEDQKEGEILFSETMTYPVFPYGCKEPISASQGGSDTSGTITIQMKYDANTSGRHQKYKLYLRAFTEVDNGDGTFSYTPEPTVDVGLKAQAQWTTVQTISGVTAAVAKWTDLDCRYKYNVYVEEIRSTGSQTTAGVEHTLGKTFVVNREGFYYEYAKDTTEPKLDTASGKWADIQDGLLEYTRYAENVWDTPINTEYISFNITPYVKLAPEGLRYAGNDPEKIQTANGEEYLLVEQNMADKTFRINVAAWDPDGSREDSAVRPSVRGALLISSGGNTIISGKAPAFGPEDKMPTKEEDAVKAENLYPITFDGSGLNTGIYNILQMRASDSDTEATEETTDIELVINRNTPNYASTKNTTKLLQNELTYNKEMLVQASATVARDMAADTDLTKVALRVMPETYEKYFGTGASDYNTLYRLLVTEGNNAAFNKAKELLSDVVGNPTYVNGTKLTVAGMNLAVVRVAPPVTRYITITKEKYDEISALTADKPDLFEDGAAYWLDLNYALDHNLCNWLVKVDETTVKPSVKLAYTDNEQPIDKENTYLMKLVAHFGGNTASQTIDFIIRPAPSTEILSEKEFIWQDTAQKEYEYYAKRAYTIADVVKLYEGCYTPGITMEEPETSVDDAFRMEYDDNGKVIYQVYKLVDWKGNVGNDFISGEVRTNMGVNEKLEQVGVLLVTDKDFNPNNTPTLPSSALESPVYNNYNNTPVTAGGDLRFSVTGLNTGTHYYLWSYYKLEGQPRVYSKSYVALTTVDNYSMAQYGFTRESYSYKEKDYVSSRSLGFNIGKQGSADATAVVRVEAKYYRADQHGNLELGADGQPIELTGEDLAMAKQTIHFDDDVTDQGYVLIDFGSMSSTDVHMTLGDNTVQQGHMVVRLTLTIEESRLDSFCYVTNGGGYTDIFVQDDESPITSYVIGVINKDENGEKFMNEVIDSSTGVLDRYEYQFGGLQVDYPQLSMLTLTYTNEGTGDLEDISVKVYNDRNGREESPYFEAETPSETNLKVSLGNTGTVEIHPVSGLADGVYEGWVFLTAEYVEEPLKIKVRQVVGQTTLKGRIYVTPDMPSYHEYTGTAKIYLYDMYTSTYNSAEGRFTTPPTYVAESNAEGGEFVIENILNEGSLLNDGTTSRGIYYVVIERDGFLTYNTRKNRPSATSYWLKLDNTSRTYTFNLRLIGGDVDGNGTVDQKDMNILLEYYNTLTNYDDPYSRKCDFNGDGMINALDRMYLTGNIGCNERSYSFEKSTFTLTPDP